MNKIGYCKKCRKETIQKVIEKDCIGKGTGIFRIVMCAASFGMSEVADNYTCQCSVCGEINDISNY